MNMIHSNKKIAYLLPNSFTALNLLCGHLSIFMSIKGEFYNAAFLLILGAIFDSVDGRVARLTGTSGPFGEQFDSMSDLISFGIAPSMLFYFCFLKDLNRVGIILSFLFLLCGALRLARFNANIYKIPSDFFQGMPIPMGALTAISYVLLSLEYPQLREYPRFAGSILFMSSILMISTIPFPSFKNSSWVRSHLRFCLFLLFMLLALFVIYETIMLSIYISVYLVGTLLYLIINLKKIRSHYQDEGNNEYNHEIGKSKMEN